MGKQILDAYRSEGVAPPILGNIALQAIDLPEYTLHDAVNYLSGLRDTYTLLIPTDGAPGLRPAGAPDGGPGVLRDGTLRRQRHGHIGRALLRRARSSDKEPVWFDHAGHGANVEESGKFNTFRATTVLAGTRPHTPVEVQQVP